MSTNYLNVMFYVKGDRTHVRISNPGESGNVINRPATAADQQPTHDNGDSFKRAKSEARIAVKEKLVATASILVRFNKKLVFGLRLPQHRELIQQITHFQARPI